MKKSKKLMIMGLSAATAAVAATGAVSSFAWFATSGTVNASGMKVKATVGEYLQIKYAYTQSTETPATPVFPSTKTSYLDWVTQKNAHSYNSVSLSMANAKELKPTSLISALSDDSKTIKTDFTNGGTSHKWVSAIGQSSVNGSKADDATYTDVTTDADLGEKDTDAATKNVYTLVVDYDLRLLNLGDTTTEYNLTASVEWATPSSSTTDGFKLRKAARVFIVVGDAYDEAITSTETTPGYELSNTSGAWTSATIKSDFKANTGDKGLRVRTFFYFDGEDAETKTVNVDATEEYSYKINFTVAKASA